MFFKLKTLSSSFTGVGGGFSLSVASSFSFSFNVDAEGVVVGRVGGGLVLVNKLESFCLAEAKSVVDVVAEGLVGVFLLLGIGEALAGGSESQVKVTLLTETARSCSGLTLMPSEMTSAVKTSCTRWNAL